MYLRGIHLLIFSCMREMVWKAFKNTTNSCPQFPSALSFPSEEMQREGRLLLLPLKVTDMRGLPWIAGTASEHRFQPRISLAAPIGKMGIRLSVLLENNVNICMFYQTDQASNTQKVGEEMRRQKIDPKTSKKESESSLWCSLGKSTACIAVSLYWAGMDGLQTSHTGNTTGSNTTGAAALLVLWRRMHMVCGNHEYHESLS